MFKIFTLTIVFVMVVAIEQIPSYVETYIGEFYFQTPSVTENFEDAKSWCSANSSALAVVRDDETQVALTQFLSTSQLNSPMYINIKLHQEPNNTWYLVNGSQYRGSVGNQENRDIEYKQYCYLRNNSEKTEFPVEASNPSNSRKYICDFEGIRCQSNLSDNFMFKERCYEKYEDESLSWYKARESCIKKGGDLAMFQPESGNSWIPPFNTSWLNISLTYWVGIRYKNGSWKSPDDAKEVIYTSWSNGKPDNINYSCVCVDSNGSSAGSWTDCDCSAHRQFVCLKIVPTTTVITTTPTTTTMTSKTTKTPITTATNRATSIAPDITTDKYPAASSGNQETSKKIGLGVGIGGGLFIILVVVIVVLVIIYMRRKRRSNGGSESRLEVESNGEDNDNMQHIQVAGGKDVYAVVNKPQLNPVNNVVYAAVVPNENHQANKTESPTKIIYSAPDFAQEPKTTPSESNYEEANPVRDDAHTLRRNTNSIFPQSYSDLYVNAKEAS